MFCRSCKAEVDNDSKFCVFCGKKTLKDEHTASDVLTKNNNVENKKTNGKKTILAFLVVLFFVSIFYWYELRPTQIKKQCSASAIVDSEDWEQRYDYIYKKCLHNQGL
jgi:uncharacterized membrane protein YvbJ